jgi:predicted phage terminase large subunit-like protein
VIQVSAKERAVAVDKAREEFYFYTRWMMMQTRSLKWLRGPHHQIICDALMRVYLGLCKRLIINIPPRYSKTELVSNFVSWTLGRHPDSEYIYTSYSGMLAVESSVKIRDTVQHEAYREIFPAVELTTVGMEKWKTTRGGVFYAAGTEGTITGFGAGKMRPGFGGALIFDDPHKPDEVRSDTIRKGVITRFQNTVENRLNSRDTPIIGIMQRLHEEDLAGWLLGPDPEPGEPRGPGGNGEVWELVCLPALQDDGTALWPEKHTVADLQRMQQAKPYSFSGQYQQKPSPPEGGFFKPHMMPVVTAIPFGTKFLRGWDLAGSVEESSPYSCGLKLGLMPDGRWIIADVVRFKGLPHEVEAGIVNTAGTDGKLVRISIPQDPGQAGKAQVAYLTKQLAGFSVSSSPESGDKVTRAEPAAAQVNVGNVCLLQGPWNDELKGEMTMFPNSKFKDQVDALSRAFAELSGQGTWSFAAA